MSGPEPVHGKGPSCFRRDRAAHKIAARGVILAELSIIVVLFTTVAALTLSSIVLARRSGVVIVAEATATREMATFFRELDRSLHRSVAYPAFPLVHISVGAPCVVELHRLAPRPPYLVVSGSRAAGGAVTFSIRPQPSPLPLNTGSDPIGRFVGFGADGAILLIPQRPSAVLGSLRETFAPGADFIVDAIDRALRGEVDTAYDPLFVRGMLAIAESIRYELRSRTLVRVLHSTRSVQPLLRDVDVFSCSLTPLDDMARVLEVKLSVSRKQRTFARAVRRMLPLPDRAHPLDILSGAPE